LAELSWHLDAIRDLDEIAEFTAAQSPVTASLLTDRISRAVGHLRDYPEMGRVVPEIGDASYREVLFQNYRIVYRYVADGVTVLAVVHGAMDMHRQIENREWDLT